MTRRDLAVENREEGLARVWLKVSAIGEWSSPSSRVFPDLVKSSCLHHQAPHLSDACRMSRVLRTAVNFLKASPIGTGEGTNASFYRIGLTVVRASPFYSAPQLHTADGARRCLSSRSSFGQCLLTFTHSLNLL